MTSQNTYNSNTAPTTGTTGTTAPTSTAHEAAKGIKGAFAAVHGAGEAIRGTINSAVDDVANDREGVAKNNQVAGSGLDEIETGRFSSQTKNREGAIPGDKERRTY